MLGVEPLDPQLSLERSDEILGVFVPVGVHENEKLIIYKGCGG
jgi:hypothetical protein